MAVQCAKGRAQAVTFSKRCWPVRTFGPASGFWILSRFGGRIAFACPLSWFCQFEDGLRLIPTQKTWMRKLGLKPRVLICNQSKSQCNHNSDTLVTQF